MSDPVNQAEEHTLPANPEEWFLYLKNQQQNIFVTLQNVNFIPDSRRWQEDIEEGAVLHNKTFSEHFAEAVAGNDYEELSSILELAYGLIPQSADAAHWPGNTPIAELCESFAQIDWDGVESVESTTEVIDDNAETEQDTTSGSTAQGGNPQAAPPGGDQQGAPGAAFEGHPPGVDVTEDEDEDAEDDNET